MTTLTGYTVWIRPPETWAQALERQSATMGRPEVLRYFYGSSALRWPPGKNFAGTTPLVVSFDRPPAAVLAGQHDAEIRAFLAALPRDRVTWVSYEHEMDAKVRRGKYTAAAVKAAYVRVAQLVAAAGNPQIRRTLILTGWDFRNRLATYWPGGSYVDCLAVDKYRWTTESVDYLFRDNLAVAAQYGKPLGIAEFGVWTGSDAERANYISAAAAYTQNRVPFIAYLNVDKSAVAGDTTGRSPTCR